MERGGPRLVRRCARTNVHARIGKLEDGLDRVALGTDSRNDGSLWEILVTDHLYLTAITVTVETVTGADTNLAKELLRLGGRVKAGREASEPSDLRARRHVVVPVGERVSEVEARDTVVERRGRRSWRGLRRLEDHDKTMDFCVWEGRGGEMKSVQLGTTTFIDILRSSADHQSGAGGIPTGEREKLQGQRGESGVWEGHSPLSPTWDHEGQGWAPRGGGAARQEFLTHL